MAGELEFTVVPTPSYVERVGQRQLLNVDLELRNAGDTAYRVNAIELDVYDDGGGLALRRVVDEHGLRPPIETIPDRDLEPGGRLCVFNPFHTFDATPPLARVRVRCTLVGVDGAEAVLEQDVAPVEYRQVADLRVPVRGRVFVAAGHDFLSPHRRIDRFHPAAAAVGLQANSARYADDFSIARDDGALFERDGRAPNDWYAYAHPVHAPGAGRVVASAGDVPDSIDDEGRRVVVDYQSPMQAVFGNHLVIDHGHGEFSLLAHLLQGSVRHGAGDEVRRGDTIGAIGFSGDTDFAHLHYQLQDGSDLATAEGLPASFGDDGFEHGLEPGSLLSLS